RLGRGLLRGERLGQHLAEAPSLLDRLARRRVARHKFLDLGPPERRQARVVQGISRQTAFAFFSGHDGTPAGDWNGSGNAWRNFFKAVWMSTPTCDSLRFITSAISRYENCCRNFKRTASC